jgi:succinate dehydrogenase / fumarate reductase cytochrome b subunit
MTQNEIPNALISRRMHSLTGIWLTIFLMQHLLVNSQAAYFFGADGEGFIHSVNSIRDLPYLPIIEISILGLPIFVHMVWGIKYLFTAKFNSSGTDLTKPVLPYPRNKAYTWQRITSYFLVFGIIGHVVHMRFIEYPEHASINDQHYYMVRVTQDEGIYTLAERLDVDLYNQDKILIQKKRWLEKDNQTGQFNLFMDSLKGIYREGDNESRVIENKLQEQTFYGENNFIKALEAHPIKKNEAIAVAKNFGTAELLMLRETFKIPIMIALYSVFVIAACFHAFNGLWTFLISWGVTLTEKTQRIFLKLSYGLMFIFSFLGLSTIWVTYWLNLKH